MNALFCGSRDWKDARPIRVIVKGLRHIFRDELHIIHGGARGADELAGTVAGFSVPPERIHVFPADWRGHGRAAGPIRNKLMLGKGKPDIVFAFKDDFDHLLLRGGTENMVKIAKEAGIPTYVISHG